MCWFNVLQQRGNEGCVPGHGDNVDVEIVEPFFIGDLSIGFRFENANVVDEDFKRRANLLQILESSVRISKGDIWHVTVPCQSELLLELRLLPW